MLIDSPIFHPFRTTSQIWTRSLRTEVSRIFPKFAGARRECDAVRDCLPARIQSSTCNSEAPGALVVDPTDPTNTPTTHTVVAKSTLALVDAKYVEGPCVDDIEYFLGGHAFLRSGQIFVIRDDGSVKLYPPQGLRGDYDVAIDRIASLPGYKKVMARQVRVSLIPAGKRESYIGLFRGKSDSVIAKFDMLNGNPLAQANILIRSQSPITSVDYLPAPDAPQGRIGFVQPAGTDKAWLYTYDWNHGDLSKL